MAVVRRGAFLLLTGVLLVSVGFLTWFAREVTRDHVHTDRAVFATAVRRLAAAEVTFDAISPPSPPSGASHPRPDCHGDSSAEEPRAERSWTVVDVAGFEDDLRRELVAQGWVPSAEDGATLRLSTPDGPVFARIDRSGTVVFVIASTENLRACRQD